MHTHIHLYTIMYVWDLFTRSKLFATTLHMCMRMYIYVYMYTYMNTYKHMCMHVYVYIYSNRHLCMGLAQMLKPVCDFAAHVYVYTYERMLVYV